MSATFLLAFLLLVGMFFIWIKHSYKVKIKSYYLEVLSELAEKNMYANEVPVSAILVYQNTIVGKGRNTMVENKMITGHAELNALNEAFAKFGNDFYTLNKKQLALYTTLEPCPMCKGALIQHGITQIYFDKPKSLSIKLKTQIKSVVYEIKKLRFFSNNLQGELFKKHPSYRKHNKLD